MEGISLRPVYGKKTTSTPASSTANSAQSQSTDKQNNRTNNNNRNSNRPISPEIRFDRNCSRKTFTSV